MALDSNYIKYESRDVVRYYVEQTQLQRCEENLFRKYVAPNSVVLDLGVGAGRTTPYLSESASRYVGADYSDAMISACRTRFPGKEFVLCDASNMSLFPSLMFDVVIFSFNGIDVIRDDERRSQCISEVARILKPNGVFIFSSHNARMLFECPDFTGACWYRVIWRILRNIACSLVRAPRYILSGVFVRGEGYVCDPVHGGMYHYVSTVSAIESQLKCAGFSVCETLPSAYPRSTVPWYSPWVYYACKKII